MHEVFILFLFIVILLFFFTLGVPVAFSLGLTTLALMFLGVGIGFNPELLALRMFGGLNSFMLLSVPFFMFAGRIMNAGGMTTRIFDFADALVGRFKGGLGHVNIVASLIFSGMSGSATADVAGLGVIEYKSMKDAGYSDEVTIGVSTASSLIGPIIPPSIPLVMYAIVANVSVGGILLAGIVPGLIITGVLMLMTSYYAHVFNFPYGEKKTRKEIFESFKNGILALGTPLILIGGIYSGQFTPTEAAAIAVVYALILAIWIYKELTFTELWEIIKQTMLDSAVVLLLIGVANVYGFMIVRSNVPMLFTEKISALTQNRILVLLIINGVLLVVGMFLDNLVAISILTPILLPLATKVGVDPIHFGVILVFNTLIGLITPPYGNVLFVISKSTGVPLDKVVKGCALYYIPLFAALALITFVPALTTWLPGLVFGVN